MPLITSLQNPLTSSTKDDGERKGGQSPPPERQSSKQMGTQSSGQTTSTDQKQTNEEFLKNLDSNPTAPMDATADSKTKKPGNPVDGL
ncbi:hypothetical protein ABW20_dc0108899 [Dactylellina cionopaga]|nr:hypothetical protein ABW20_dc0108899 [Dactylellina cionopaga]